MAKPTMLLVILLIILAVVAAVCALLAFRSNGLSGSGIYFLAGGSIQ